MQTSKTRIRSAALVLVMALAAGAQTASETETPEVMRVAAKLKCSCGCNQNMACQMTPGCAMCKMNKAKIVSMQKLGMSDNEILNRYVVENGKDILVIPPGLFGTVAPYIALLLGLGLVFWTIRRYMGKRPAMAGAPEIDPTTLAEIDKNLANLE
jgi:cytochrome c-type biogenesis protein CcmH/NrfF